MRKICISASIAAALAVLISQPLAGTAASLPAGGLPSVTTPAAHAVSVVTSGLTVPSVTVPSATVTVPRVTTTVRVTPTVSTPTLTTPRLTTPTVTTPRLTTPTVTTPKPVKTPTVTTPKPVKTPTVTTPKPVKTPTVTTPKPVKTPTVTTPKPVKTPTVTTPRPVKTPTVTTPSVTTPRRVTAPTVNAPALPTGRSSSPSSGSSPGATVTHGVPPAIVPPSGAGLAGGATRSTASPNSSRGTGAQSTSPVGPAGQLRSRRAAVRRQDRAANRRLQSVVKRYRGCLSTLDSRSQRLLSLRAGLHGPPRSPASVAGILHISAGHERLLERRSLLKLQTAGSGGCGHSSAVTQGWLATTAGSSTSPPSAAASTASVSPWSAFTRNSTSRGTGSAGYVRASSVGPIAPIGISPGALWSAQQPWSGRNTVSRTGIILIALLVLTIAVVLRRARRVPALGGLPAAEAPQTRTPRAFASFQQRFAAARAAGRPRRSGIDPAGPKPQPERILEHGPSR